MRGTSSSHTLRPIARRASKPAHIPAAIGTGGAPIRQRDDAPAAPEPSTRVSVHTHRHLPTKCQKPRTSTRNRMGSLATEPPKARPTKNAHRHNPPRSVYRLYMPPAIHPREKLAIGSQRPHFNQERHRITHVHQPNPQTHNPASQIHSITTVTAQEGTKVLGKYRREIRKVWKELCHGKAETLEDAEEAARWWRYNLVSVKK